MLHYLLTGILLFASTSVRAQTLEVKNSEKQDSWYVFLSAGIGFSQHDSEDTAKIDNAKFQGADGRYTARSDMPTLYFKIGDKQLLGLGVNFSAENYAESYAAATSLVFHNYFYHFSVLRFWQKIGEGFFVKGDFGQLQTWRIEKSAGSLVEKSFWGLSSQVGVGYGFVLPNAIHFLSSLNVFSSFSHEHPALGVMAYVGFLL